MGYWSKLNQILNVQEKQTVTCNCKIAKVLTFPNLPIQLFKFILLMVSIMTLVKNLNLANQIDDHLTY
jgi:hypothetical protein